MIAVRAVLACLLLAACGLAFGADPRLVIQTGHARMVTALTIDPQGRWMASGGEDGAIAVWDLRSGFRVSSLSGPATALVALRFDTHKDGVKLTGMGAGSLDALTWDLQHHGRSKPLIQNLHWLRQTSSLDGIDGGDAPAAFGVSGVDGFDVWTAGTAHKPWRYRKAGSLIDDIAVGPGGKTVATLDQSGELTLWTRNEGRRAAYSPIRLDAVDALRTMFFNRRGQLLVATRNDYPDSNYDGDPSIGARLQLDLWDTARAVKISSTTINAGCLLTPLAFSDAGHVAVGVGAMTIFRRGGTMSSGHGPAACNAARLGLIAPGRPAHLVTTRISADAITVAAFDQRGAVLGLGYADGALGTLALPSDLGDGAGLELKPLGAGQLQPVAGLALLSGGNALAVAAGRRVTIWDFKTGHPKYSVTTTEEINAIAGNATLDRFAVAQAHGDVWLRTGASGAELFSRAFGGDDLTLALSGDGRQLAVGRASLSIAAPDITPLSVITFPVPGDWVQHSVQNFPHIAQGVFSLAYSDDSSTLASGHGAAPQVRQAKARQAQPTLKLFDSATGRERRSIFPPSEAQVRALAFQPNGKLLAVGSTLPVFSPEHNFLLWDGATGRLRRTDTDRNMHNGVAFSPDGKQVAVASVLTDGPALSLWNAGSGKRLVGLSGHSAPVSALAFNGNTQLLSGARDGTVRLWPVGAHAAGAPAATLVNFRTGGDWLVASATGQFDTNNPDRLDAVAWVFPDDPLRAFPAEIFTRVLYAPGLFGRLLTCSGKPGCDKVAAGPVRMDTLNRVQPYVAFDAVRPGPTLDQVLVDVTVRGSSDGTQRNGKVRTGAYDLRLFRDGKLVGQVPPPAPSTASDAAAWRAESLVSDGAHTFPVRLARGTQAGEVVFTAYAFNEDRVKSATARLAHTHAAAAGPGRTAKAYVITVGVNTYDDPAFALDYAVKDARDMGAALAGFQDYEVVRLQLLSDRARTGSVELRQATRENFRSVLALLAGDSGAARATLLAVPGIDQDALAKLVKATPDDLVIIVFSGHGYADPRGQFHLLPSDTGTSGAVAALAAGRLISSADLSDWLRQVDAGQMALIIDACHAAASVNTPGFRPGLLGDAGLGQLAYDKGMLILAATQASDVALEVGRLQQGLLTYALVNSALAKAGTPPRRGADLDRNGELTLREWLRFGAQHVPQLYAAIRSNALPVVQRDPLVDQHAWRERIAAGAQTPALFDFQKGGREPLLLPPR